MPPLSSETTPNTEVKPLPHAAERGVVAAASYEARAFGVRSVMPSLTALETVEYSRHKKIRLMGLSISNTRDAGETGQLRLNFEEAVAEKMAMRVNCNEKTR